VSAVFRRLSVGLAITAAAAWFSATGLYFDFTNLSLFLLRFTGNGRE
jgi:hypothetical protein